MRISIQISSYCSADKNCFWRRHGVVSSAMSGAPMAARNLTRCG